MNLIPSFLRRKPAATASAVGPVPSPGAPVPAVGRVPSPGVPAVELAAAQPLTAPPKPAEPAQNTMNWIVPAAQIRWLGPGMSYYTPQIVEQIFRQALAGDLQSQWEMFDLMETTWPRLSKNLNQLKDDVISNEMQVKAFALRSQKPSTNALERAAFVEEALWSMNPRPDADENDFEDTMRDLLDARGKGISIVEIDWEMRSLSSGPAMVPRCTRWVHPAWYGYPQGAGNSTLMLKMNTVSNYMGTVTATPRQFMEFPEHKFIIGVCKNKTGHPLGTAMLHCLGFWWAFSNFTAEWALNFCQVFGQPMRWATYDPNMTPTDQTKLQLMLQNMGSAAWGMFPEGTQFELKETAKGSADNIQKLFLDHADKVCDLLILRQTLTSDVSKDGGSRAQGEVHERVLDGVELACAKWTCKTLNQLVRAIVMENYGDVSECPFLKPPGDDEDDSGELAKVLVDVHSAGLEPTDDAIAEISERLGFAVQRQAAPPPSPFGMPGADPTVGRVPPPGAPADPNAPDDLKAKSASTLIHDPHITDVIAGKRKAALAATYRGAMAPFREAILNSATKEECLALLAKQYTDWTPTRLNNELNEALQIAAAAGAAEGTVGKAQ
jgi:phage gp29-like protein